MHHTSEETIELRVVFDYTVQKVPTRTHRDVLVNRDGLAIQITLLKTSVDEKGYPDPRALWFIERTFLKAFNEKHPPDVRLLGWQSRLEGDSFTLSEYRVLLSTSAN